MVTGVPYRRTARSQLRVLLDQSEREHLTLRVIPFDRDEFAGANSSMTHAEGAVPQLATVLRDTPHSGAFIDAQAKIHRLNSPFLRAEQASLGAEASRDLILGIAREL